MKSVRPRIAATLLVLAVVAVASWLVAGSDPPSASPVSNQEAGQETTGSEPDPLPDFQPTEKLPAGSAVAFPTDI